MQTTPNGIPFPESSDNVRLWEHFAQMAAAIDPQLDMPVRQVFTASGTWSKPDGAKWLRVQVLGAGGGGGGVPGTTSSTAAAGGGGGGGGYAESIIAAASVGESVAVTVGAGGAGGTALNVVGSGNPAGT
ncbi:glycine-rich domain-containing protein, partial [Streptomyces sp. NPDC055058]